MLIEDYFNIFHKNYQHCTIGRRERERVKIWFMEIKNMFGKGFNTTTKFSYRKRVYILKVERNIKMTAT